MRTTVTRTLVVALCAVAAIARAATWTDAFDGAELRDEWSFRDIPDETTTVEIIDNALWMTVPDGNFGHLVPERPMLERALPAGIGDLSISAAFTTEPDIPQDAWHGLFIIGDDAMDWAVLGFAGAANDAQTGIVGSMFAGPVWEDKGHPPTNVELPFQLKLEKVGENYTGYVRATDADAWAKLGNTWTHDLTPVSVGIGFINSWGGSTVSLITDWFSLEGDGVAPLSVDPTSKLAARWAAIKRSSR
ncbi:hypothetical protein HN371_08000 [Candidatus Poribacteria bacterium]|jgi:hypothetical protein|nr:hypothetical protein [Candidatus Poribacteria bacterium]MBT5532036.1 hypothetical protein [Candidatus Poribacteria bacterium]MBT5714110.1 hypothetical protein [Candidatus Poribacteria bacterium]MBT7096363.1 hypothetical protein [Candidatus Poribacteria bacterium]MBT7804817.1 hypothetical protein [Candidatus Poribacteria bacterium]